MLYSDWHTSYLSIKTMNKLIIVLTVVLSFTVLLLQEKGVHCSSALNDDYDLSDDGMMNNKYKKLVKSEAWKTEINKWPSTKMIRYRINDNIDSDEDLKKAIDKSMKMIKEFTCLDFIKQVGDTGNFIEFVKETDPEMPYACHSEIGMQGGRQVIILGEKCGLGAGPAREIMHALGRYDEHQRGDRDEYLTIKNNGLENFNEIFEKITSADTQKIPYDYLSLMQIGEYRNVEIEPKIKGAVIGQRHRLSMYDALHINMKYCPDNMVRLVGGKTRYEGRVEVFWNGQWGSVCGGKSFGTNDAKVICKYLGSPGFKRSIKNAKQKFGLPSFKPVWFDNLECKGNEPTPFHCPNPSTKKITKRKCPSEKYAGVVCKEDIVLRNKRGRVAIAAKRRKSIKGRVEVYVNGKWGTICNRGFDKREAKVICRQLGYKKWKYLKKARYHWGKKKVMMSECRCTGREKLLSYCREKPNRSLKCKNRRGKKGRPAVIKCMRPIK